MKRSRSVRLILIGGLSTGALTGCSERPSISTGDVYTNNFYVPGVGYYHAPFHNWYALPYNHFEPHSSMYFYGGQWGVQPFESIINVSSPTPEAVVLAEARRTDISRGGFGGYSSGHFWTGG